MEIFRNHLDTHHTPSSNLNPHVDKTPRPQLTNNCWLNELYSVFTGQLASYKESKGSEYVEGPTTIWTTAYANAGTDNSMQDDTFLEVRGHLLFHIPQRSPRAAMV